MLLTEAVALSAGLSLGTIQRQRFACTGVIGVSSSGRQNSAASTGCASDVLCRSPILEAL